MAAKDDFGADPRLPPILLKRHRVDLHYDSWKTEDRFVFIIRDYRECILRNVPNKTDGKIASAADMFVNNMEFFDGFDGDKILIYYEDLMRNPANNFNKIFAFLNINTGPRYNDFINNIMKHRSKGLCLYHDTATTQGATNKLEFHANREPGHVVEMVDAKIRSRCGKHLYDKYLSRYRPY
jgi:hypothetical protein